MLDNNITKIIKIRFQNNKTLSGRQKNICLHPLYYNYRRWHGGTLGSFENSYVILTIQCNDSVQCEKNLINIFKQKFIQKTEYGLEYFEGNMDKMINIIENTIKENDIVDNVCNTMSDKLIEELVNNLIDDEVNNVVDNLIDNLINNFSNNFISAEVDNVNNVIETVNYSKMSQHICNKCHKDLKYLSTLQRHQAYKKDCTRIMISNNIGSNQSNTTANINIEDKEGSNNLIKFATSVLQDTINKAKTDEEKKILFNDFITLFNKNNSNQVLSLTNTNKIINIKNVCTDCNHKFYDKQTLNRHKKNGKCKSQNKLPIANTITNDTKRM